MSESFGGNTPWDQLHQPLLGTLKRLNKTSQTPLPLLSTNHQLLPSATKLRQGYVFTGVCGWVGWVKLTFPQCELTTQWRFQLDFTCYPCFTWRPFNCANTQLLTPETRVKGLGGRTSSSPALFLPGLHPRLPLG